MGNTPASRQYPATRQRATTENVLDVPSLLTEEPRFIESPVDGRDKGADLVVPALLMFLVYKLLLLRVAVREPGRYRVTRSGPCCHNHIHARQSQTVHAVSEGEE